MANFLIVGRREIPRDRVALVEPFTQPSMSGRLQTRFYGRVILDNRDSILVAEPPVLFSREHGFCWLSADGVGLIPTLISSIEHFLPPDGFVPSRAFSSRAVWRDRDGNEQSKLLLTEVDTVMAVLRSTLGR